MNIEIFIEELWLDLFFSFSKWREANSANISFNNKIRGKWSFSSTSHKTENNKKREKNIHLLITSKIPENLFQIASGFNFFLLYMFRSWWKFVTFNLVILTSNKVGLLWLPPKELSKHCKKVKKQTFAVSLEMHSKLEMRHRLLHVVVSKLIFWIS